MMLALERLWRNVSFAVRTHRKTPAVTVALVGTLALGLAAAGVSFSVLNALFIRPLPIQNPKRFVRVYRAGGGQYFPISYAELRDLRELRHVFDGVVGEEPAPFNVGVTGSYERVWGEIVSDGYFQLMGIKPVQGRFFASDEEQRGAPVVVLGHGFWRQRFGGQPNVVNSDIQIDGRVFRVIGVAPEACRGTIIAFASDLWIPTRSAPMRRSELTNRADRGYFVVARLAENMHLAQAQTAVEAFAQRLELDYPATNRAVRFAAFAEAEGRVPPPFREGIFGFSVLGVAVALLLTVVACANVAGVLLARSATRGVEIGIRLALGASRARIIGQLLTEGVLLSIAASALAIAIVWQTARLVSAIHLPIARGASLSIDVSIDTRVLAVCFGLMTLVAVLSGLAPALDASRADLLALLKTGGKGSLHKSWWRRMFLVGQVAVSMMLLAGAGLFLRSLQHAREIDLGFDPTHVVTTAVEIRPHAPSVPSGQSWSKLIDEVRRLPQTESASLTTRPPLELGIVMLSLAPEGFQPPNGHGWPAIEFATVAPDYFRTLRIPILEGRDFNDRDRQTSPAVVIVNDLVARQFWRGASPIGRRVINPEGGRYEVVGVVRHSKYLSVGEDPKPYVYFPLSQGAARAMTIVARGSHDPGAYLRAIREVVRGVDPIASVYDVTSVRERVAISLGPTTAGATVLGIVGGMALALTSLGLFGAVAQSVSRRTYEIGVRRALGAQDRDVTWLVMREATLFIVFGLVCGVAGALAGSPALRGLFYDVDVADPLVFGLAPAVLVFVCLLAAWLPTYRATSISAAAALRYE